MSIVNQKKEVFGEIAALRIAYEGFPKLNLKNSLPSINNRANSIEFLTDLLKSLVGFEALREILVDILSYQINNIELDIRKVLKLQLKSYISCSVNPTIPNFFLHQTINPSSTGVNLEVKKIDFNNLYKIDPTSDIGSLFYSDNTSGLNSLDFNTFFFETLQNQNTQQDWGSQTLNNDILSFTFEPNNPTPNTINIKASQFYSNPSNNKTLTDLNNDYIDSLTPLFDSRKLLNSILDSIFGNISLKLNKTEKELQYEIELEKIIDNIIESDFDDVIDDSFFVFNNDEILNIENQSKNKKKGVKKLTTCANIDSTIDVDEIIEINDNILLATPGTINNVLVDSLNTLSDAASNNVTNDNKYGVKLDFINDLLKRLVKNIIINILNPKVIMIFAINYVIITGSSFNFNSIIDFLKENKILIRSIFTEIKKIIVSILLKFTLREINNLISGNINKRQTEKVKNYRAQLLSLTGTPPEVLRIVSGLG